MENLSQAQIRQQGQLSPQSSDDDLSLIQTSSFREGETIPLIVTPITKDVDLVAFAKKNQTWIEQQLLEHGALLFRNFQVTSDTTFRNFASVIVPELLEDNERSTRRSEVSKHVFTASEYPETLFLPLHNEMSLSKIWPLKICFFCLQAPTQGGETPFADSRKVFDLIAERIRNQFIQKKILYVRNYRKGLDLSWEEVFQTTSRSDVEAYCQQAGIRVEWKGKNLKTWQFREAVAAHPKTGEMVWFNQAHAYHISNLEPTIRNVVLESFVEEDLPMNTYYGDGTRIEDSALDAIREAYAQSTFSFPWQEEDILMLDNMLMAHGRAPFRGPRKILVAMGQPYQPNCLG